jgi:hypothetical protein
MACCIAWCCPDNTAAEDETILLVRFPPSYHDEPDPSRVSLFRQACEYHAAHPSDVHSRQRMSAHIKEACLMGQPTKKRVYIIRDNHCALAEYVNTLQTTTIQYTMVQSYVHSY